MDTLGDHVLKCCRNVGPKNNPPIKRHNHIVRILTSWLRMAGISAHAELTHGEDHDKPDITVYDDSDPSGERIKTLFEVTITNTDPIGSPTAKSSATYRKRFTYDNLINEHGAEYYIVMLSSTGAWLNEKSLAFFEDLVGCIANKSKQSVGTKKRHFFGEIAQTLCTGFGHAIIDSDPDK